MARCLLLAAVLLSSLGVASAQLVKKQNATWIYPTPGCRAQQSGETCYPHCPMQNYQVCDKASVCQPTYIKSDFGKLIKFTMAAGNPTPPDNVFISRKREIPGFMQDTGMSCCGFNQILGEDLWTVAQKYVTANNPEGVLAPDVSVLPPLFPEDVFDPTRVASLEGALVSKNPMAQAALNITWVEFTWNVTQQIDTTFAVTPIYNLTFDAQYEYSLMDGRQRLHNTSACQKHVVFRICSSPFFEVVSASYDSAPLLGAPRPKGMVIVRNPSCGLANHTPCVRTPGRKDNQNRFVYEVGMFDSQDANHGIRVGELLIVELRLRTLDYGGVVIITPVEDPGLPIGAHLTDDTPCGEYVICRNLTWTPRKGQEDKVHNAHVVGHSESTLAKALNPCDKVYTAETLFSIKVLKPVSSWIEPALDIGEYSDDPQDMNAWTGNAWVGTEFKVTLRCKSNYMPRIDMSPTGGPAHFACESTEDLMDGNRIATYVFRFTPVRGDEGSLKDWEFHCGDDQDVNARLRRKVRVKTKLCSYSVAAGDTLSTMTRRYQLTANWLNVWNANPTLLTDPDLDLSAGSHVRIGPVYSIKGGDTLHTVAGEDHPLGV